MTLQRRFFILLLLLTATVIGAFVLLQYSQRNEAVGLMHDLREGRAKQLERILDVTGQPMWQLSRDYSLWDDMVTFVSRPDPAWAKINLQATLDNFAAFGIWVLKTDGSLVYATDQAGAVPALPLPAAQLMEPIARDPFARFFVQTDHGLLEIRTGPIQPSADIQRKSPPLGWLVVAKHWDGPFLKTLSRLMDGRVSLTPAATQTVANDLDIELSRPLNDWRGQAAANLHLRYHPQELFKMLDYNVDEMALLGGTGALLIATVAWGLYWLVLRPLGIITDSLSTGRADHLARLEQRRDEFSRLAGLVKASFSQRVALEQEIEDHHDTERELRSSKEELRETLEERARLGRDLHDGVIQTLYATGLTLSRATKLLSDRPEEAAMLVETSRVTLGATIREVRQFILGLEPEAVAKRHFRDNIASLFSNYQHLQASSFNLDVDDALADDLSLSCRADLLQIIREAVSNAMRHGRASRVDVSLRPRDGSLVLSITDNGTGFDSAFPRSTGHGLRNLEARAAGLGSRLDCWSSPGQGTRITVVFPIPNSHAHETDQNSPHPAG